MDNIISNCKFQLNVNIIGNIGSCVSQIWPEPTTRQMPAVDLSNKPTKAYIFYDNDVIY